MPNESLHVEPHHERLDADAVCERCGTVSPEETLICKTCGNNLRDQRMRRIAAGGEPQVAGPRLLRWSWLASALTLLGLLLLVWTVMNLEEISQSLFTGDASGNLAREFWEGPDAATYEGLLAELAANPVTEEETEKARASEVEVTDFSGRYVIVSNTAGPARVLGTGIAKREGDVLYFAAQLERGAGEVRGQVLFMGTAATPAANDTAAILYEGEYELASGVALKREEDAGLVCYAQTPVSSNPATVLLYKVP
jgi:hypothetical protein